MVMADIKYNENELKDTEPGIEGDEGVGSKDNIGDDKK
jgi:hypothetical protein